MKVDIETTVIAKSHDFESTQCVIDSEDMRYISSLLRNNYTDPMLATIREIYANAVDANLVTNEPVSKIEVTVPTAFESSFIVRDFGPGLSHEQMVNLYTKYGKSTKRTDQNSIGGFGIGRLAPLSYNKDGFMITSYHNGTQSIYKLYIDEFNDTKLDFLHGQTDGNQPNGLKITVDIPSADRSTFLAKLQSFFATFDTLPNFVNYDVNNIVKFEPVASGPGWRIVMKNYNYTLHPSRGNIVIMGGIAYPLDLTQLDPDIDVTLKSGTVSRVGDIRRLENLHLTAPIGTVKLHHSREGLEYNSQTKSYIVQRLVDVVSELQERWVNEICQQECYVKCCIDFQTQLENVPTVTISILQNLNVFVHLPSKIALRGSYERDTNIRVTKYFYDGHGILKNRRLGRWDSVPIAATKGVVLHDEAKPKQVGGRIGKLLTDNKYDAVYVYTSLVDTASGQPSYLDTYSARMGMTHAKSHVHRLSQLPMPPVEKTANKVDRLPPTYFRVYPTNRVSAVKHVDIDETIQDTQQQKVYVLTSRNQFVNSDYASSMICSRNEFKYDFKQAFYDTFGVHIYGVSSVMGTSLKFKQRADFVLLEHFITNYWNGLTQEQRDVLTFLLEYRNYAKYGCRLNMIQRLNNTSEGVVLPTIDGVVNQYNSHINKVKSWKLEKFYEFMKNSPSFFYTFVLNMPHTQSNPQIVSKTLTQFPELEHYIDTVEYLSDPSASKTITHVFARYIKTSTAQNT